jgi:hypothetical protein
MHFAPSKNDLDLQFQAGLLSLRMDLARRISASNACEQYPSKRGFYLILGIHKFCARTGALGQSSVRPGISTIY